MDWPNKGFRTARCKPSVSFRKLAVGRTLTRRCCLSEGTSARTVATEAYTYHPYLSLEELLVGAAAAQAIFRTTISCSTRPQVRDIPLQLEHYPFSSTPQPSHSYPRSELPIHLSMPHRPQHAHSATPSSPSRLACTAPSLYPPS